MLLQRVVFAENVDQWVCDGLVQVDGIILACGSSAQRGVVVGHYVHSES